MQYKEKDIVVYGSGFAGCAAALKAAKTAPTKTVALICADPVTVQTGTQTKPLLGGIGTVGGQNFWDKRPWTQGTVSSPFPQRGSFEDWFNYSEDAYSVLDMSEKLRYDISQCSNIEVFYAYDLYKFDSELNPYRITAIYIQPIYRQSTGYRRVVFNTSSSKKIKITAAVFVDASESGKLARVANFGGTTGRYDWPADRLDSDEQGSSGKAHQQAATLMFKIKNIDADHMHSTTDMTYVIHDNVVVANGGKGTYKTPASTVHTFNEAHEADGDYAIKPINMATDYYDPLHPENSEWWVNALLVFNVDGRANYRDMSYNGMYPQDKRADYMTTDQAWKAAYDFLNDPVTGQEVLTAIRGYPTLSEVDFVRDANGKVVVADILYLRETVHMGIYSTNIANGTEDTNYAVKAVQCEWPGQTSAGGYDNVNYATRVGLNFYWTDINAYKFEDLKDENGNYIWFDEVAGKLRPDRYSASNMPWHPVYVPYNALTTKYVANLLIPGYAAGVSSYSWAEMRVLSNQCVLGDAAGVAAGYAVLNNVHPLQFTTAHINAVQNLLSTNFNVRLEK